MKLIIKVIKGVEYLETYNLFKKRKNIKFTLFYIKMKMARAKRNNYYSK